MVVPTATVGGELRREMLLAFQAIASGDYFEFTPDRVLNGDYRVHLEHERRKHRAKLVDRQQIVAFHQWWSKRKSTVSDPSQLCDL